MNCKCKYCHGEINEGVGLGCTCFQKCPSRLKSIQEIRRERQKEFIKLKEGIIKTDEISMLYHYRDLAIKLEKEGKITPEEASDIYEIFILRK